MNGSLGNIYIYIDGKQKCVSFIFSVICNCTVSLYQCPSKTLSIDSGDCGTYGWNGLVVLTTKLSTLPNNVQVND